MIGDEQPMREAIKPPVAKVSPAVAQVFGGKAGDDVVTFVPTDVQVKTGEKDGKTWTKYGIHAPDGKVYGTFKEDLGHLAQDAMGDAKPVTIRFAMDKTGKYYNVLTLAV